MENSETKRVIFAGGCFWCTEASFNPEFGVISATSGYFGGDEANPTYEEVARHKTGHREVVEVVYDAKKTSLKKLLVNFWHSIDPTDAGGQFADRGLSYQTAIYYFDDEDKKIIEGSKDILEASKKFSSPIATEILDGRGKTFWKAEEYHQNYEEKNPIHYGMYKKGSGREAFLKETWHNDETFKEFLK